MTDIQPEELDRLPDQEWVKTIRSLAGPAGPYRTVWKNVLDKQWDYILSRRFEGDGCAARCLQRAVRKIRDREPTERDRVQIESKPNTTKNLKPIKGSRRTRLRSGISGRLPGRISNRDESGTKRVNRKGHNGCALIRWCAARKWTLDDTRNVLEKIGIAMNPATFKIQHRKGVKEINLPKLSELDAEYLHKLRNK